MVFIPLGDSVMKKSSSPAYMKLLPDSTRKNWGTSMNTLIGRVVAAKVTAAQDRRLLSTTAATASPTVDNTNPMTVLLKFVKPAPNNKKNAFSMKTDSKNRKTSMELMMVIPGVPVHLLQNGMMRRSYVAKVMSKAFSKKRMREAAGMVKFLIVLFIIEACSTENVII